MGRPETPQTPKFALPALYFENLDRKWVPFARLTLKKNAGLSWNGSRRGASPRGYILRGFLAAEKSQTQSSWRPAEEPGRRDTAALRGTAGNGSGEVKKCRRSPDERYDESKFFRNSHNCVNVWNNEFRRKMVWVSSLSSFKFEMVVGPVVSSTFTFVAFSISESSPLSLRGGKCPNARDQVRVAVLTGSKGAGRMRKVTKSTRWHFWALFCQLFATYSREKPDLPGCPCTTAHPPFLFTSRAVRGCEWATEAVPVHLVSFYKI